MSDPIKPATTWQETQAQSFEELRAEANAQKAKRENLQPLELGKGRYKDIFKVGDRTRPELALTMKRPEPDVPGRSRNGRPLGEQTSGAEFGSGELPLETLIPKQALRDLVDAYAGANVGAMGEAMEGVRETITYDKDESEQLEWVGQPERHLLAPQAQEQAGKEAENAAFIPDEPNDGRPLIERYVYVDCPKCPYRHDLVERLDEGGHEFTILDKTFDYRYGLCGCGVMVRMPRGRPFKKGETDMYHIPEGFWE